MHWNYACMKYAIERERERARDFNVLTSNEAIIQANDGNKEITTIHLCVSLSFSVSISVESNHFINNAPSRKKVTLNDFSF